MIRPIGLRYRNSIKFCIQDAPHATSENTLREFPLVIATVAKVSRKRGLWLVVREKKPLYLYCTEAFFSCPHP